jgi:hypothetical protein
VWVDAETDDAALDAFAEWRRRVEKGDGVCEQQWNKT